MYEDVLKSFLLKQRKRSIQYFFNIIHGKGVISGKSNKIIIFTLDDLGELLTLLRDNGCLESEVIDVTSDNITHIL